MPRVSLAAMTDVSVKIAKLYLELQDWKALQIIVLEERKLPHISRFDPVAKFLGLRPGVICKIIRNSYTSGEAFYYRLCV